VPDHAPSRCVVHAGALQPNSTAKDAALQTVENQVLSGFDNGDWLGTGITSSSAAADQSATGSHKTALGIFDNASIDSITFNGEPIDSSTILIALAVIGDTNDDGLVDSADVANVMSHIGTAQSTWTNGDLNYDGVVDAKDLALVNTHLGDVIPEPTTLGLLVLPAILLATRRRKVFAKAFR
jgi:hypothetical protein